MEGAELHSAAISMRSSFPVPDGASAARRTETDHAATSAQRDDEQQRQDDHPKTKNTTCHRKIRSRCIARIVVYQM